MSFFADFIFALIDALMGAFVSLLSGEIVAVTDGVLNISGLSDLIGG